MTTYLILFTFTQKGEESIATLPSRVENAKEIISKLGGEFVTFYGILGSQYDTMCIVKAANDEKIAAIAMAIARLGNVRAETHPLFTEDDLKRIAAIAA